ncbi:hypothetical protein ABW19_dt0207233 [Dactylella cylindrospora]|nr:hypothetical protein ABW19_dt0207233 [Dactylella cylindrospora]
MNNEVEEIVGPMDLIVSAGTSVRHNLQNPRKAPAIFWVVMSYVLTMLLVASVAMVGALSHHYGHPTSREILQTVVQFLVDVFYVSVPSVPEEEQHVQHRIDGVVADNVRIQRLLAERLEQLAPVQVQQKASAVEVRREEDNQPAPVPAKAPTLPITIPWDYRSPPETTKQKAARMRRMQQIRDWSRFQKSNRPV